MGINVVIQEGLNPFLGPSIYNFIIILTLQRFIFKNI